MQICGFPGQKTFRQTDVGLFSSAIAEKAENAEFLFLRRRPSAKKRSRKIKKKSPDFQKIQQILWKKSGLEQHLEWPTKNRSRKGEEGGAKIRQKGEKFGGRAQNKHRNEKRKNSAENGQKERANGVEV